jgi:Holliday junction resolvasome RuvABC endonuclease subunit
MQAARCGDASPRHHYSFMRSIPILGIDPSMANFGLARMMLNLETLELTAEGIRTIQTEPQRGNKKVVRQNSDDLRRAKELFEGFQEVAKGCIVGFTEVPSGSQHSRSALGFGMSIGILASSPIQLIEVMPIETKLASVGKKTAEKHEIIAWAAGLYPDLPWLRYESDVAPSKKCPRGRKTGDLHDDNEHMADAIGVVHAGIQTVQFTQLLSIWKASAANFLAVQQGQSI